jgi:hypothetical protein
MVAERRLTESCDGNLPGVRTCRSVGFEEGSYSCTNTCWNDTRLCRVCGRDPRVKRCLRLDDARPFAVALASRGTDLAMAWIQLAPPAPRRPAWARFALLSPDLEVRRLVDCFGEGAYLAIVVAPTPSGWIVGFITSAPLEANTGMALYALDPQGTLVSGPHRIAMPVAVPPKLVARPDGGPLLLYGDTASLRDETGAEVWTRKVSPARGGEVLGAYVSGGFVWAANGISGPSSIIAGRLELDGTFSTTQQPVPAAAYYQAMVSTGTEARLVANGYWLRLDRSGARIGSEVKTPGTTHPAAAVLGENVIVAGRLAPTQTNGDPIEGELQLVRLDASGRSATPPFSVLRDGLASAGHSVTQLGTTTIVAQITYGLWEPARLFLASVRTDEAAVP